MQILLRLNGFILVSQDFNKIKFDLLSCRTLLLSMIRLNNQDF